MQKITPFLWFDNNCEEAMNFYTSVFKNSKIHNIQRGPDGKAFTGTFNLDGQEFMALNAGPTFKFNEAVSFFVNCKDQEEVDYYWDKLTADGGEESRCGWLKDKFGLSWQIVPEALGRYLSDPDPKKANNAMQAMLKMNKIIVADLENAYNQE
ncbi:MAG: VOC family protein [Bacteroidia bacterium]